MNCIFCEIILKKIPAKKVYEDELVLAFHDLEPQAPVHILITPKKHIPSTNDLYEDNISIVGHVFLIAMKLAKKFELDHGYRIINNCGDDGGQSVTHLHFHLLGGRKMKWPPG